MQRGKLVLMGVLAVTLVAVSASTADAAALNMEAIVDTTYCASGGVQCTVPGTGHTAQAASSANHNPIRMFVIVRRANGLTVNNLTAANFAFANPFLPAGGGPAVVCAVAVCGASNFQNGGGGLYSLFLDRGAAGNWKAGTYGARITATTVIGTTNFTGTALVTFTIPQAVAAAAEEPSGLSPEGLADEEE